jgi:hypothetical protein
LKEINPPIVDDIQELQLLADNSKLGSYPDLLNEYIIFRDQYNDYIAKNGDPWRVAPMNISNDLKKALIYHYDHAPKGRLKFIKSSRYTLSPTFCPMCGGFGNGTMDHYLPKTNYPEYSFFSKNLIPACNCNSLRGTAVKGAASPARAIHPYFDDFLDERLYQAVFRGGFETPKISIEIIDNHHPKVGILQFHLDEVIVNDATQGWFDKYWVDLSLRAHNILELVLPVFPNVVTEEELLVAIERYRNSKDKEHDTPNNWLSIFYTGLMRDSVRVEQLAIKINSSRQNL